MKKFILCLFLLSVISILAAGPINLFNYNPQEECADFESLSMEDQYESVLLSFETQAKGIPILYETKWAGRIVQKYGRDILPLVNRTITEEELFHQYRETVNRKLCISFQFIYALVEKHLITDYELSLYEIIINEKIDKYILKYRAIDRNVYTGFNLLSCLNCNSISWNNIDYVQRYYEQKLGITGIAIGKDIFEDVVESPLAEYVTD